MQIPVLTEEIKELIKKYYSADLSQFQLSSKGKNIPIAFIVNQIKARRKAADKLPTWFLNDKLIFPSPLSVEQSSSEATARRKSQIFTGKKVLDMTGGMGVDAYFIASRVEEYTLVEQDEELVEINKHNFSVLHATNIKVIHSNSLDYLEHNPEKYDFIYIDPARRSVDKESRVFLLEDCRPNVLELQVYWLEKADNILVKLAPMLDIQAALTKLQNVHHIYIISWKNEVKEFLVHIRDCPVKARISCINLLNNKLDEECYESELNIENEAITLSEPLKYIYEPNKAILKAGLQDQYAASMNLSKIDPNTQFYTGDHYFEEYQGRVFELQDELPMKVKQFKKLFPHKKAMVVARNHQLKASEIVKRFQLIEGGEHYILAFRSRASKHLIGATRLK